MSHFISSKIREIIQLAPKNWLSEVSIALRNSPLTADPDFVKKRMPVTGNSDLAFLLHEIIDSAFGQVSWEGLGWGLEFASDTYNLDQNGRQFEMLWSGPAPAGHLAARRIDQVLYDLIDNAKNEILLVTFAAVKVERLAAALMAASKRGVKIRLIFEFAEASEGQLSFDALKAFPSSLIQISEVYFWPVDQRERNIAGRPGKLHAKLAVVDNVVLVSSANLTDDAFSRNLEIGVRLADPDVVQWAKDYFGNLISNATLKRIAHSHEKGH